VQQLTRFQLTHDDPTVLTITRYALYNYRLFEGNNKRKRLYLRCHKGTKQGYAYGTSGRCAV